MADNTQPNYYPAQTANQNETNRIIFDNLYSLRDQMGQQSSANTEQPTGLTGTAFFKNGFTIGGSNNGTLYHNLIFSKGMIVGMS